jgi:hypothetical protein
MGSTWCYCISIILCQKVHNWRGSPANLIMTGGSITTSPICYPCLAEALTWPGLAHLSRGGPKSCDTVLMGYWNICPSYTVVTPNILNLKAYTRLPFSSGDNFILKTDTYTIIFNTIRILLLWIFLQMKNPLKISLLITKSSISQTYIYVRYVIIRNDNLQFKVKFNHKRFPKGFKMLLETLSLTFTANVKSLTKVLILLTPVLKYTKQLLNLWYLTMFKKAN